MGAVILDGRALSARIREGLKRDVSAASKKGGTISLSIILVGNRPASEVYVKNKLARAAEVGIRAEIVRLPESVSEKQLLGKIGKLNASSKVTGMIVQLPLPGHMDPKKMLASVSPEKDVDGFHPLNTGLLSAGMPGFIPATPKGIIRLLEEYKIGFEGRHAVVVGRSDIVGKPVSMLLLQKDCTVTICHSKTGDLAGITRQADILVSAVGRPGLIRKDMVREGAAVVDVGTSMVNGKLAGDVDFEGVKEKAGWITPVPGGVGPMTVAMLLENTVRAARLQAG